MDGKLFDDLAKLLATGHDRRRLLRGVVAGVVGGALGFGGAAAQGCRAGGRSCRESAGCCSGRCIDHRCACPEGQKLCRSACVPVDACCTDGDCATLGDQCNRGACDRASGHCRRVARPGVRCDDGNPCTTDDVCQADGSCAGTPVACDGGPACTDGVCDPARGCLYTTRSDACLIAGTCYASGDRNPANPCQRCDPGQSQIAWSNAPRGTSCDDGNPCTAGEACDGNGRCEPGEPVVCDPPAPCQEEGVCNPTTGTCDYEVKQHGAVCRAATDQCHDDAVCDGVSPDCPANPVAVGRACDDGRPCTTDTVCRADGFCVGTPIVCPQPPTLCRRSVCDPDTGGCVIDPISGLQPDRKGCLACTACWQGQCLDDPVPVNCGLDSCKVCDPDTGACTAPAPAGTDCGSDCTTTATCDGQGSCHFGLPGSGGCINIGTCPAMVCDPDTAACVETGANDGKSCGSDQCHVCKNGACAPKTCGRCERCDPSTGACVACADCCGGVCGQATCGNRCCAVGDTCLTGSDGAPFCCPSAWVCKGKCALGVVVNGEHRVCCDGQTITACGATTQTCCYDRCCTNNDTCCGSVDGKGACCPPDTDCCADFFGGYHCCSQTQTCTVFGCTGS